MTEKIVVLPRFRHSPGNPARCHIPTGTIEINGALWPFLTPEQQEFVLNHERGHRDLKTYNEVEADNYALNKMALKKPYSLRNHIDSVKTISKGNQERVHNAQVMALRVAAKDGSTEAARLLQLPMYANATGNNHSRYYILCIILIIGLLCWIKIKK